TRSFWRFIASGWSRQGLRENRLSSGLPFLLLLAAVVFGLYWLSFAIIGQPGAAMDGHVAVAGAKMSGPVTINTPTSKLIMNGHSLPTIIAATVASVVGLSVLGLLFSVVTRSRWAAWMLSAATVAFVCLGP